MKLFQTKQPAVGCSLRPDRVVLAQQTQHDDTVTTLDVATKALTRAFPEQSLASDAGHAWLEEVTQAVQGLSQSLGFKGSAVLSLPDSCTVYHPLRMARLPDAELASAVRWQAARELGKTYDTLQTDHLDLGETQAEGRTMRELLVVASPLDELRACRDAVNRAGLRVTAIDAGREARLRGLRQLAEPSNKHSDATLWFVVGRHTSTVQLTHPNGCLLSRTVDVGDATLSATAQTPAHEVDATARLSALVTLCDELVREAMLCLHAQEETWPGMPLRGVLVWDDPALASLAEALGQGIGHDVTARTMTKSITVRHAAVPHAPLTPAELLDALEAVGLTYHTLASPRKEAA